MNVTASPVAAMPTATHRGLARRRLLLLAPVTVLLASCSQSDDEVPSEPTPLGSSVSLTTVVVSGLTLEVPESWTRESSESGSATPTPAPEEEAPAEGEAAEGETEGGAVQDVALTWAARFTDGDDNLALLVSTVFPAGDLDQASALSRALVVEALSGAVVRTSVDLGAEAGEGPVRLVLDRGGEEPVATAWTVSTSTGYCLIALLVDDDQARNAIEGSVKKEGTA